MRGSGFIWCYDGATLLYNKCQKINYKRGGSSTDSPDWIKEKKGTIYPKNKDDKCFQYAATVVLSYGEIKRNSERISNTKPFISKYN